MSRHSENAGVKITKINPEKSMPARAALLTAVLLLFMIAIGNSGPSLSSRPLISTASVEPSKVRPGDSMLVSAQVSSPSGVSSVSADMGWIETILLSSCTVHACILRAGCSNYG